MLSAWRGLFSYLARKYQLNLNPYGDSRTEVAKKLPHAPVAGSDGTAAAAGRRG